MPLGGIMCKGKRARRIGAFNDRPNGPQGRPVSNGWQEGQKNPILQRPEGKKAASSRDPACNHYGRKPSNKKTASEQMAPYRTLKCYIEFFDK